MDSLRYRSLRWLTHAFWKARKSHFLINNVIKDFVMSCCYRWSFLASRTRKSLFSWKLFGPRHCIVTIFSRHPRTSSRLKRIVRDGGHRVLRNIRIVDRNPSRTCSSFRSKPWLKVSCPALSRARAIDPVRVFGSLSRSLIYIPLIVAQLSTFRTGGKECVG